MPKIELKNVTKRWGGFYAVENLNLSIDDASFVTLLGPSGCGKTTTLRMIAGLETPTSGRIEIGDTVVFDSDLGINIPPNKRKVGFLFQNYALWPNMTVYDNIAFGLSNIKGEMAKVDFEARNAAKLIDILSNPADVVRQIEDCRNKKGALDQKKAYIKLIDAYTISMFTAKELYKYDLQSSKDPAKLAADITAKLAAVVDGRKAAAKAKGMELNAACEFTRDGKTVMEERKLTREEIDLSVRRVSRIVKISMFMDRYPAELSGGQQQRVAIARTLAPEPSVLFMDEPLSNLDAKLRVDVRTELRQIQQKLGITTIYVTHDQDEALSMSDIIAVMRSGHIEQIGSPWEIYFRPANRFVADFVGTVNFLTARIVSAEGGTVAADHNGMLLQIPTEVPVEPGETVTLVVRPECIRLAEPGESVPEGKSLEGQIENYSFLGRMIRYWVRVGEEQFIIDDANVDLSGARSGAVQLCLDTRKLHILKDGGSHDT